ncbi:MAG: 4Fe-4S binding protein, partial [Deltaproteobacteria bacterium]|nr:4Fe-4S binding protein [Deltaproteobacteria bacterium]
MRSYDALYKHKKDYLMIKVIHTRCQPWLHKNAKCRLCADVCPVEGCISFNEDAITIDNDICIGCGICTNVCPTSALVMDNLSDRELLQKIETCITADDKDVVFGCSLGSQKDSRLATHDSRLSINLPCLAILKESHLASIVLSGAKNIYIDTMGCNDCSFKYGKMVIEQSISYANNLLKAAGYEDCIKTDHRPQAADCSKKGKKQNIKTITPVPEYSRRELLYFFKEKAVERIIGDNENKGGDKKTENIPDRRSILLETFNKVGNNLQTAKIEHGSFPVNQLVIGENCTLCHDCNLFCPTGALTRVEEYGEVRIDFNMALCMGCYECKELCPEDVIDKQGAIDINRIFNNEVKTIFKKKTEVCPSCGKTF